MTGVTILDLGDLIETEFDQRLPIGRVHQHLQPTLVDVDLTDSARSSPRMSWR
jgi:hypothetical protein